MISLDTNVIVRYLVVDNLEQAEAARELLEGLTLEKPGFISREVILEVVWVLERAYNFSRDQIADVVLELIATDTLVIEADQDVATAVALYRQRVADFSDLMILAASINAGAIPLYTFDRKFARMDDVVLLNTRPQNVAQLVAQPTHTSSSDASEWIPLSEPRSYTRTKPAEIMFPDGSIRGTDNSWAKLIAEVTGWLHAKGYLNISDMPIQLPRATTRYLVSDRQIHPSGNDFVQPQEAGPLYVETNYNASTLVGHTRHIIAYVTQDPSQFKVRLSS